MRLPETLVVGIFGRTCSGKTSVATALAKRLGIHCRHCGDIVKQAASARAVSPASLDRDVHRAIDSETRALAEQHPNGAAIIEGSFLHYVLAGLSDVVLIELDCEDTTRSTRFVTRGGKPGEAAARDDEDTRVAEDLYKQAPAAARYRVDVTHLSIDEVADQICEKLGLAQ